MGPGSTSESPGSGSTPDPTATDPDDSTGVPVDCMEDADCSALDDACAVGVCDGGTCAAQPQPDGTGCDDGTPCTEGDACMGGECTGQALECETTGPCGMGACNPETGACEQVPDPELEGTACDDMDPCTGDGTCTAGACEPGPDECAALSNDCQMGTCGAAGCEVMPINEGQTCNVSNNCASSTCQQGTCTVVTPLNENAACDDGLWCTYYELCIAGVCTPGPETPCPGEQGCGTWTCDDDQDACVVSMPQNEGAACNDGISCTLGTSCQMGECTGGVGPMIVFEESFADNSQGWSLGPQWEIGPAQQTPCNQEQNCNGGAVPSAFPGGDPDLDHTPTGDNGIAGVVIGGIIDQNPHPQYYLESPAFNGDVPGPVFLSFFRWLNSDYTPYIENRVEVFDGVSWQVVWASGPSPAIADAPWSTLMPAQGWNYQEYDVTPFKNPQMRVRFGFDVGQSGVYPAPGWNVDDVRVATAGCPDGP